MVPIPKICHHTDKPSGMGNRPITAQEYWNINDKNNCFPFPIFVCVKNTLPSMQMQMPLRYALSFLCAWATWTAGHGSRMYTQERFECESLCGSKCLIAYSTQSFKNPPHPCDGCCIKLVKQPAALQVTFHVALNIRMPHRAATAAPGRVIHCRVSPLPGHRKVHNVLI